MPSEDPPVLLLLSLIACREHPDGPPSPPDQPPSVDTASPASAFVAPDVVAATGDLHIKTLALHPEKPTAQTDLNAKVEASGPKDRMITVHYQWLRNDAPIEGFESSNLPHTVLRRNDRIRLHVTVSDGERELEADSETLVIGNSPPTIEIPRGGLNGQVDGVQVKAKDPDNDSLSYRIKDGPPGLSIDAKGVLHFSGSKAAEGAGVYHAEIIAEDSGGLFAAWPITFDLRAGQADQKVLPGAPRP